MNSSRTLIYDRKANFGTLDSASVLERVNYFFRNGTSDIKFPEANFRKNVNDGKGVKTLISGKGFNVFFLANDSFENSYSLFFQDTKEFTTLFFPWDFPVTTKEEHKGIFSFLSSKFHDLERIIKYSADQPFIDDSSFRSKAITGRGDKRYQVPLVYQLIKETNDSSFAINNPSLPFAFEDKNEQDMKDFVMNGVMILVNKEQDRFLCFYPHFQNKDINSCYFQLLPYSDDYEPSSRN